MDSKLKLIWASAISAIITGLAVVAVTIYMELVPGFKPVLTSLTGHHWITKSLGSIILYFLLFVILSVSVKDKNEQQTGRALWTLFVFTILSAVAIFAFFVGHYLVA